MEIAAFSRNPFHLKREEDTNSIPSALNQGDEHQISGYDEVQYPIRYLCPMDMRASICNCLSGICNMKNVDDFVVLVSGYYEYLREIHREAKLRESNRGVLHQLYMDGKLSRDDYYDASQVIDLLDIRTGEVCVNIPSCAHLLVANDFRRLTCARHPPIEDA